MQTGSFDTNNRGFSEVLEYMAKFYNPQQKKLYYPSDLDYPFLTSFLTLFTSNTIIIQTNLGLPFHIANATHINKKVPHIQTSMTEVG